MRYRPLGRTGAVVSELAFGAMTFGTSMPPITKVDQRRADQLVSRALDAGVNLFDTADTYGLGESEHLLGQALGKRRGEVLIATKYGFSYGGPNDGGLSARHTIASAEASLRRLGTDWIDVFQIHKPDPLTPLEETLGALDNLVRRGLVRYVGCCNVPAWQAALGLGLQRQAGWATFASAQMYWSLVGRDVESEFVPLCRQVGLGLLIWSPLAGGFLTDRWRQESERDGSRRGRWAFPPVDPIDGDRAIAAAGRIADARDLTIAQVCLAWLLSRSEVTSVILGASSVAQLEENLAASGVELGSDELEQLDGATEPRVRYPGWLATELPDPMREILATERRTPPQSGSDPPPSL